MKVNKMAALRNLGTIPNIIISSFLIIKDSDLRYENEFKALIVTMKRLVRKILIEIEIGAF